MVNCNKYKGDSYTNCVKRRKEAAQMNIKEKEKEKEKEKTIAAKKNIDPEDSKYSHVLNSEVGINEKGDFDNIERRTIQDETVPAAKLAPSEKGGKTKRRSKKSKKSKKKRRTRRKGKKSRKSRK